METAIRHPDPDQLKVFLTDLFSRLDEQKINYAVCGNHEGLPEKTEHDIDIWTDDTRRFEELLNDVATAHTFAPYLVNRTANGSNRFYCRISEWDTIQVIRFDVLSECAWKSVFPLVSSRDILAHRIHNGQFWHADKAVETAMHLLYPLLTKRSVREKYRDKIRACAEHEDFRSLLTKALGKALEMQVLQLIQAESWETLECLSGNLRRKVLLRTLMRPNPLRLLVVLRSLASQVSRFFSPSGLFIALSGVDGAGKTTVSNNLQQCAKRMFLPGKIKNYYWRPYLLPPIRKLVGLSDPEADQSDASEDLGNRERVRFTVRKAPLYLFKFFYYWLDFILGNVKYRGTLSRGGLVIFDRYYYDQFVFPDRFKFTVPDWMFRAFSIAVPRPDLTFYLGTEPEILIARKFEFEREELERQMERYHHVLSSVKGARFMDVSMDAQQVTLNILKEMLERMQNRRHNGA